VEQNLIYHLEPLCSTPVLMALMLLKHYASNENHESPCVLSLFNRCPSVLQLTLTTGHMSHMVTSHAQRQMKLTAISTNQAYQCSFVTQNRKRITKFIKEILMKPNIVSTQRRILYLQVLLDFCYIYMEISQRED
jgi:hypothetical protein